jgi:hypothetical protein
VELGGRGNGDLPGKFKKSAAKGLVCPALGANRAAARRGGDALAQ